MIDLDLLDERLEQALSDEVRVLRGTTPRGRLSSPPPVRRDADWSVPTQPAAAGAAPEPVAPPAPSWEDDWDWSEEPDGESAGEELDWAEDPSAGTDRPGPAAERAPAPNAPNDRPQRSAERAERAAPAQRQAAPPTRPAAAHAAPAVRETARPTRPAADARRAAPIATATADRSRQTADQSTAEPQTVTSSRPPAGAERAAPTQRKAAPPSRPAADRNRAAQPSPATSRNAAGPRRGDGQVRNDRTARTAPPGASTRPSSGPRPLGGRPLRPAPASGTPLDRLRQAAAALAGPDGKPRDLLIADHARLIADLVARGEMPTADQHIATHAGLTAERGITEDRADAAAWETMRALLDGRREDARDGVDAVRRLGERAHDVDARARTWTLRFWVGLEWGSDADQCELLDHSRERAYRYDDLLWRSALTLQLARLGRVDEAAREFDAVAARLKGLPKDATSLDILTNLAEAAFLLGDGRRASLVGEPILTAKVSLVTVGPAWVCKGSVARYAAHVAAAKGEWDDADRYFAAALKMHRRIHAEPLVARTLCEWGTSLLGRNDDLAHQYLDEGADLAARLRLAGVATVAA